MDGHDEFWPSEQLYGVAIVTLPEVTIIPNLGLDVSNGKMQLPTFKPLKISFVSRLAK